MGVRMKWIWSEFTYREKILALIALLFVGLFAGSLVSTCVNIAIDWNAVGAIGSIFSAIVAVVAVILGVYGYRQSKLTHERERLADQKEYRAYLRIDVRGVAIGTENIFVNLELKNYGRTPANNIVIEVDGSVLEMSIGDDADTRQLSADASLPVVHPGDPFPISVAAANPFHSQITSGRVIGINSVSIIGVVRYRDEFDIPHEEIFEGQWAGSTFNRVQ